MPNNPDQNKNVNKSLKVALAKKTLYKTMQKFSKEY